MGSANYPSVFLQPGTEDRKRLGPMFETVNKLGSPFQRCSEARTIAWAAGASPYREPESVAWESLA